MFERNRTHVASTLGQKEAAAVARVADLEAQLSALLRSEGMLRAQCSKALQAQELLEEVKANYEELLDLAPCPLLTLSIKGTIRSANLAAAELLGGERSRLVGAAFADSVRAEHRATLAAFLAERISHTCDVELEHPRPAGLPVRLRRTLSAREPGLLHLTLEERNDREFDAAAYERLLAEVRAKDQFIAALSHELRTPLAPVLIAATTLSQHPELSPKLRRSLGVIVRNVRAEARLVDDLLDMTRLAQKKLHLERRYLDLAATLSECVEAARSEALERKVLLDFEPGALDHCCLADPLRMTQVFSNLLAHAVKLTPAGGEVRVSTRRRGAWLVIEVRESGAGLPPQEVPRVLEPFARVEGVGQLGLGLALSKSLVELHGGKLSAWSAGTGLGLHLLVEMESAHGFREGEADDEDAAAEAMRTSGILRRCGVLLIEDDEDTRAVLRSLLEMHGYHVLTAESVAAALAVDLSRVDILLCDEGLPDGTGTSLLPQLRQRKALPAIAMSGYAGREDIERFQAAGFEQQLLKPVDIDRLLRVLSQMWRDAVEVGT